VPLVGGCRGGLGGGCATDTGGAGGGAVQVSVAATLNVTGSILADGAIGQNGACGCSESGGGGGGSGGAIVLEGQTVTVATGAIVRANGGRGGNGQGGGSGGAGGTRSSAPSNGGSSANGGGGGGGAAGRIRINAPGGCTLSGTVSAVVSQNC